MGAVTATATALGTARTVTMLFTDIEGSTVLLRRLGPRWGEALTAHREIVRAAIAESRGEEMGTEGDSFRRVRVGSRRGAGGGGGPTRPPGVRVAGR